MEIKQIDDVESDEKRVVLQRNIIQINGKRALVLAGARVLFYPTLLYNLFRNKIQPEFRWWDQVDQFLLLGAVPFPKDVPRLKHLGVHGVVTLNESYETFVPTSLYQSKQGLLAFEYGTWTDMYHQSSNSQALQLFGSEYGAMLLPVKKSSEILSLVLNSLFLSVQSVIYLKQAYDIEHLVIPTRDYLFAPSLVDISRAVDFIHKNASCSRTTYVHCKAGRGRSTTIILCYLVKYKKMTPRAALEYVREKRPRVLLAAEQWKAVQEYGKQHSNQIETSSSLSIGDEVLVTETDLEGYRCPNNAEANRPMKQPRTSKTIISKLTCIFSALKPFGGTKTITFHGLPEVRAY